MAYFALRLVRTIVVRIILYLTLLSEFNQVGIQLECKLTLACIEHGVGVLTPENMQDGHAIC